VPEPEAVHPRVDLQVVRELPLVLRGRGGDRTRRAGRRDRRRQAAVEQAVEVADAERAEDQDVGAHARRTQLGTFFDVRAREQIRARVLEGAGHLAGAVPVGIRLDDGDHARRAVGPPAREMFPDVAEVAGDGTEIDPRDRGTDHPIARFSNRVNSRMNASLTTPVGPFRCLPMMSSATP
jgi:hypothetical protein